MFELAGVTKRYGDTQAVGPVDLVVPSRRTLVLIGPSGSGKSTLVKLMMGLIEPDAGRVRFEGRDLGAAQARALRRRMGYVVQGGGLFPHLTAEGNVSLLARHLGWDGGRIRSRVEELAALTRFPGDGLARFPVQLSGGQAQRVSLMRALMLDPDVLLLDEPLGALDPMTRFDLQADLKAVFERLGKTVVLVTHDLGEAAHFGDRIVLLRGGQLVQEGTLDDLVRVPADPFVTRFVRAQRGLHRDGGPGTSPP